MPIVSPRKGRNNIQKIVRDVTAGQRMLLGIVVGVVVGPGPGTAIGCIWLGMGGGIYFG